MTNNNVQVTYAGQQVQNTITSLEVAEMVGRNHADVMRDIRNIIAQLGESKIAESTYFISSTYVNTQNKEQPMFSLTKKGCELYSTRMTGAKGTAFAVKYIERFNEMEQVIQRNLPSDPLELALTAALETRKEVAEMREDVDFLKDNMRISRKEQKDLFDLGKSRVMNALGGYNSVAYGDKSLRTKLFRRMWTEFNNHFGITSYNDIPKIAINEGLRFLSIWEAPASLKLEIAAYNRQLTAAELTEGWEVRK